MLFQTQSPAFNAKVTRHIIRHDYSNVIRRANERKPKPKPNQTQMKYSGNRNKPMVDADIRFENVMKMLTYRYQDGDFQKM